ncbi:hypothetical protein B0T16DRAFT_7772 [Cercophora newfieldiana]|uniref:Uncharacterized protein n=1 Tax=Cercophora newfieldiana TaxID=92897 RepID=A0AA40CZY3_9PEZI|nr:hypothetical protein B0T16DRAFT_7772 [Cercophora newfieldiana]
MPPVDLDRAVFWNPPGAAAAEPDNATRSQLREDQSRRLRSLPEPESPTAPTFPQEDTDRGSRTRSLNSNADVVVISDDNETGDDDDGSTAASDFDDPDDSVPSIDELADMPKHNDGNPAVDDSDASYPDIDEVLRRSDSHLDGRLNSPSEVLDLTCDDPMDWSAAELLESGPQTRPRIATPRLASVAPAASAASTPTPSSPIPHDSLGQADTSLGKAGQIFTTDDDARNTVDQSTVASPARDWRWSHPPGTRYDPRFYAPTPSSCRSSPPAASPPPLAPRLLCDSSRHTSESPPAADHLVPATAIGEGACGPPDEIDRQSPRPRRDRGSRPFHATSRGPECRIADVHGRDGDEVELPSRQPKRRLSRFRRGSAAYREDWRERHGDKDYEQVSTDEVDYDDDDELPPPPPPPPRKRRKPAPLTQMAPSGAASR